MARTDLGQPHIDPFQPQVSVQTAQLGCGGGRAKWQGVSSSPRRWGPHGQKAALTASASGPHRAPSCLGQRPPLKAGGSKQNVSLCCFLATVGPSLPPQLSEHPSFRLQHLLGRRAMVSNDQDQSPKPQTVWASASSSPAADARAEREEGVRSGHPNCPGHCGSLGSSRLTPPACTPPGKDMQAKQFPHPIPGGCQKLPHKARALSWLSCRRGPGWETAHLAQPSPDTPCK